MRACVLCAFFGLGTTLGQPPRKKVRVGTDAPSHHSCRAGALGWRRKIQRGRSPYLVAVASPVPVAVPVAVAVSPVAVVSTAPVTVLGVGSICSRRRHGRCVARGCAFLPKNYVQTRPRSGFKACVCVCWWRGSV